MAYTKTCLIYQQDKVDKQQITSLLESLSVHSRPWESISLDFIFGLEKVGNFVEILMRELFKILSSHLNISSIYPP
ncbi:hypothetical protein V6Z11_A02G175300 [Gossypium hirsutum]